VYILESVTRFEKSPQGMTRPTLVKIARGKLKHKII